MKCVIPNYIPHKVTKKPKFGRWLSRYREDLLQLYDDFNTIAEDQDVYNNLKQPSEKDFLRFCLFIFSCSSKFIQD
jgi:hypothetical protein